MQSFERVSESWSSTICPLSIQFSSWVDSGPKLSSNEIKGNSIRRVSPSWLVYYQVLDLIKKFNRTQLYGIYLELCFTKCSWIFMRLNYDLLHIKISCAIMFLCIHLPPLKKQHCYNVRRPRNCSGEKGMKPS